MTKLKELVKEYGQKAAGAEELQALIAQLDVDRREIVKDGDPHDTKTVNVLAAVTAKRDLAAARLQTTQAQLAQLEPELVREFNAEARAFGKAVREAREAAGERVVDALRPFYQGDDRKLRKQAKKLYPPALHEFRKLAPEHTHFLPENGSIVRQALALIARHQRTAQALGWKD